LTELQEAKLEDQEAKEVENLKQPVSSSPVESTPPSAMHAEK